MVLPIGPRRWTCSVCGWEYLSTGTSDVLKPNEDYFEQCPRCSSDLLDTQTPGTSADRLATLIDKYFKPFR